MLDERHADELTGGGDCLLHYHNFDRVPTHDTIVKLRQVERSLAVSAHVTVPDGIDYVVADTTAGNVTVTVPTPANGRYLTVIKKVAANTVTVAPVSGAINGAASIALTAAYEVARLKDIGGAYYKV